MNSENLYHNALHGAELLARGDDFDQASAVRKLIEEHRAMQAAQSAAHDWPEDWAQENGQYENKCYTCKQGFIGNKHRRICKACSVSAAAAAYHTLRAMHWADGKLAVVRVKDVPLGVQTYSGDMLDAEIGGK